MEPTENSDNSPANLKALLEENLRYAKAIYATTQKTQRFIFWGQVWGVVKIVVVVAFIGGALWFIQPYLSQAISTYQDLLNPNSSGIQSKQVP